MDYNIVKDIILHISYLHGSIDIIVRLKIKSCHSFAATNRNCATKFNLLISHCIYHYIEHKMHLQT